MRTLFGLLSRAYTPPPRHSLLQRVLNSSTSQPSPFTRDLAPHQYLKTPQGSDDITSSDSSFSDQPSDAFYRPHSRTNPTHSPGTKAEHVGKMNVVHSPKNHVHVLGRDALVFNVQRLALGVPPAPPDPTWLLVNRLGRPDDAACIHDVLDMLNISHDEYHSRWERTAQSSTASDALARLEEVVGSMGTPGSAGKIPAWLLCHIASHLIATPVDATSLWDAVRAHIDDLCSHESDSHIAVQRIAFNRSNHPSATPPVLIMPWLLIIVAHGLAQHSAMPALRQLVDVYLRLGLDPAVTPPFPPGYTRPNSQGFYIDSPIPRSQHFNQLLQATLRLPPGPGAARLHMRILTHMAARNELVAARERNISIQDTTEQQAPDEIRAVYLSRNTFEVIIQDRVLIETLTRELYHQRTLAASTVTNGSILGSRARHGLADVNGSSSLLNYGAGEGGGSSGALRLPQEEWEALLAYARGTDREDGGDLLDSHKIKGDLIPAFAYLRTLLRESLRQSHSQSQTHALLDPDISDDSQDTNRHLSKIELTTTTDAKPGTQDRPLAGPLFPPMISTAPTVPSFGLGEKLKLWLTGRQASTTFKEIMETESSRSAMTNTQGRTTSAFQRTLLAAVRDQITGGDSDTGTDIDSTISSHAPRDLNKSQRYLARWGGYRPLSNSRRDLVRRAVIRALKAGAADQQRISSEMLLMMLERASVVLAKEYVLESGHRRKRHYAEREMGPEQEITERGSMPGRQHLRQSVEDEQGEGDVRERIHEEPVAEQSGDGASFACPVVDLHSSSAATSASTLTPCQERMAIRMAGLNTYILSMVMLGFARRGDVELALQLWKRVETIAETAPSSKLRPGRRILERGASGRTLGMSRAIKLDVRLLQTLVNILGGAGRYSEALDVLAWYSPTGMGDRIGATLGHKDEHQQPQSSMRTTSRVGSPSVVTISVVNAFCRSSLSDRPDIVLLLWDAMERVYGVHANAETLSLAMTAARLVRARRMDHTDLRSMDDVKIAVGESFRDLKEMFPSSLRGQARSRMGRPDKYSAMTDDSDLPWAPQATRSEILDAVRKASDAPMPRTGTWRGAPAAEMAQRVFKQAVLGNAPYLLSLQPPAQALRENADDPMARPLTELKNAVLGSRQTASLSIAWGVDPSTLALGNDPTSVRTIQVLAAQGLYPPPYPHLDLSARAFATYIALLGESGAARDIALALAWMRALQVRPTPNLFANAIAYWGEVSLSAPLLHALGPRAEREARSEYARLKRWMRDWVGEVNMPKPIQIRNAAFQIAQRRKSGWKGLEKDVSDRDL